MRVYIYGEKVLADVAAPVESVTPELCSLLDEMVPFMRESRGVGLAAPQIGVSRRFFVMDAGDKVRKVINPEILASGNSTAEMEEGCLSVPGIHKRVRRPRRITVRYQTETGDTVEEELKDYPARVFQHEFDHLDGVLFVDRIAPIARKLVSRDLDRLAAEAAAREETQ
ncbi:peptide deformylase [Methanocorpusculum vombati]|uniref:Peptide deformylase n=1 Tax=Methanocorpusculum vombati TaxID=3002864 RepID=A0ABT4IMV1_9EURY|nr:peptide deformylase [Methanocorpusculum vombati]MCZ9318835.1 peptide deformylase [Methanocorpusculum sp.]MCZ0862572.1 peptide deformylase [Methanocorpusculum vombati]MDE2521477.1 peptide deformylase [Methanocorpusculum sp.]MDE2533963.1 peptide deformylase [Methanocorpusculum sp.]MDE2546143.1 peptide deformylase [Methanocorpusculum sp.]